MRGPNPLRRVITEEEEAGGGRNVLIHRPTHPLPLISLPEFDSPLLLGGTEQAGRGFLPAAEPSSPPPAPRRASKRRKPGEGPAACSQRRCACGGAQRGGRGAVDCGTGRGSVWSPLTPAKSWRSWCQWELEGFGRSWSWA
jgi:hypothetical protein